MKTKIDIKKKEAEFYEKVYSEALEKYPNEMLDNFIQYWTEPNRSMTKVRWEAEKFFHINRRLATWARNNTNWNKAKGIDVKKTAIQILKERHGI